MEIRFTQAARKHRIGRGSVRYVLARATATGMTTDRGTDGWRYVGMDERGRELEVVAVETTGATGEAVLLVIHVMPTDLRRSATDA